MDIFSLGYALFYKQRLRGILTDYNLSNSLEKELSGLTSGMIFYSIFLNKVTHTFLSGDILNWNIATR